MASAKTPISCCADESVDSARAIASMADTLPAPLPVRMQRLHIADHADDLAPHRRSPNVGRVQRSLVAAHFEVLADRILIRKITPGQRFVDEHDSGRFKRVGLGEVAAPQQAATQRAQPIGCNAFELRPRLFLRLEHRPAKNRERLVGRPVLAPQKAAARANSLHTGQGTETFDQRPQRDLRTRPGRANPRV